MTLAYICILIAAILPYVWVGYAKFSSKGYDNDSPRPYMDKLEGAAKRAHYAHLNAFEAFPAFAVGVTLAQLRGASPQNIVTLSVIFIICRVLHGIFYVQDKSKLRTLVWVCGFICVISLFLLAIIR
jgi:uncharacterized MAPEG superfamily protein